ncbi:male-enhanced antigen 1 [Neodiprion lecontei]|uniref:Male-enhanced antigen 1 n=1 Tax=Neodiprion lecontei TaxID=441921 RepID=A0A6J0BW58_NEOLC|nr:male-enhanced antigen 1 [Neodiprion lecontei]
MMSPEPTQEPVEENLNASDLNIGAAAAIESDSEDEDPGLRGYMPLSQIPHDSDPMLDDYEDDEWLSTSLDTNHISSSVPVRNELEACEPETLEVWSSRSNQCDIDLDEDKIDQVKTAMASFMLPTTAIPEWANSVSEEQWKQILIDKIKEMQSKDNN